VKPCHFIYEVVSYLTDYLCKKNYMQPYVICHMLSSIDGKIIAKDWGEMPGRGYYEITHNKLEGNAWMCGRVTMEEGFASDEPPVLKEVTTRIDREDYVARHGASSFAIAIDAGGKLGWDSDRIDDDHIITVLTEKVSDAYLAYLQEKGVSYVFGGKEEVDFKVVLEKLGNLFPIKRLLLEGGGLINGALLDAGLINEFSLLLYPIADGTLHVPTVTDIDAAVKQLPYTRLRLESLEQLEHGVVWLRYLVKE
jgi:2,5-diamino-6-(ribosylamino)-4(3H)-pyrimidinone 5'-phosphate reductase